MLNAVITSKDKSGNKVTYPVEAFDMPLEWSDFKGYPLGFQRLYIEGLKNKYNVTQAKLSEMFGIHFSTFSRYCTDNLKIQFVHHRMSVAENEAFDAFCSRLEAQKKRVAAEGESGYDKNYMSQIEVVEKASSDKPDKDSASSETNCGQSELKMPIVLEDRVKKEEPEYDNVPTVKTENKKKSSLRDLYLKFDGELNVTEIFWTVKRLIDDGAKGNMVIKVEFE